MDGHDIGVGRHRVHRRSCSASSAPLSGSQLGSGSACSVGSVVSCLWRSSGDSACLRALLLFIVGVLFALVLNLLQVQRRVTLFPPEVLASLFSSAWWIPPGCGLASAFIGLIYPQMDKKLGKPHRFKREWSSVMRCIAVFVGINHASAKIAFANNLQLSITLGAMSIGLWWLFDRSRTGFGLGLAIAFLATAVTQLLVYKGFFQYSEPDFLYIRSWIPCIFFSGGVTMGSLGRQLAFRGEGDLEEPQCDDSDDAKLHKD